MLAHLTEWLVPFDQGILEIVSIKVIQELHLELQELILWVMSHSPHLLIDLSKEARRDESFDNSTGLSIREGKKITSIYALHDPINFQHLVGQRTTHLLADDTCILWVKDEV